MHVPDLSFVFGAIRFAKAPKVKFCRRKGQSKEEGGGGEGGTPGAVKRHVYQLTALDEKIQDI